MLGLSILPSLTQLRVYTVLGSTFTKRDEEPDFPTGKSLPKVDGPSSVFTKLLGKLLKNNS